MTFSIPLFSQKSGAIESISLYEKDLVFLGEGRRGPYLLPDSLIIQNSETVFVKNSQFNPDQYKIDYIDGELRFFEPVAKGDEIRIIYKVFPYKLQKSYSHRLIQHRVFGSRSDPADRHKKAAGDEEEDYAAQLTKSGSITRGVTVGSNRGLKVNSALNINVSGKVGDNVEVVAALTDQSTPIQPEGTTQNLQEIDKVFIQIKSPTLAATMGDFHIQYSETQFAKYNRKLQGAMGEATYDNFKARVSAAVSRGKYFSLQFLGQEGNQGPYQLKGDRGQIDIIILAGTERVFIDGELMIRGETNDYIIDYAAAQITFSRRRLITSESRVTVDFQYSDEQYRRSLYSAAVSGSLWGDKLQLGAIYLHEADDKNNPLDFVLSDDYRRILENAGDDQLKGVINGAAYVGPEKGRYSFIDSNYVYAGESLGEYNVSFSDVSDGMGDYQYKGNAVFEFVGKGNGRYAPVVLLPLPKSHDVVDFTAKISPLSFLTLGSELAISNYDQNSFSDADGNDNIGIAQNWQLSIKPNKASLLGKNIGKFSFSSLYKKVDSKFNDIDRTTAIEYNRRWDLPDQASREEVVKEFRTSYEPFTGFSISAEYGDINKGDSFSSDRWQFENNLKRKKGPSYDYRYETINRNNLATNQTATWQRQKGNSEWDIWKIKPLIEYEAEIKKENWNDSLFTGFKFNDMTGGLEIRPVSKIQISGRVSQREDKEYVGFGQFIDKSLANTQNVQMKLQQVKAFTASLDYTHRQKQYLNSEQSDSRTDLAELRMQLTPWKRAINANLNYQISNTATARKERIYIEVQEGEGNYRFDEDLNEYVYDPLGDHILRILTTDQLMPTIELKTSSRFRLEPSRVLGKSSSNKKTDPFWKKSLRALSSETYVALEERTQTDNMQDVYLLRTNTFRTPGTTIFGYLQLRQDLHLFERSRKFSVRLRNRTRDELNNQFLEGGEERTEREKSARVTTRLSKLFSSQTEVTQKRTARFFNYEGRQNRDIAATELKSDLSITPKNKLKLALEGRYSREEDKVYEMPTNVQSYALIPRVTYAFRSKGRLRGEIEWSYVDVNPKDRVIPYEMANGRSAGQSMRWDIRFDYRISQVIQATISYSGRNEPEREQVIHTGRAQVTAAFR
jgi:hypothetical protein